MERRKFPFNTNTNKIYSQNTRTFLCRGKGSKVQEKTKNYNSLTNGGSVKTKLTMLTWNSVMLQMRLYLLCLKYGVILANFTMIQCICILYTVYCLFAYQLGCRLGSCLVINWRFVNVLDLQYSYLCIPEVLLGYNKQFSLLTWSSARL